MVPADQRRAGRWPLRGRACVMQGSGPFAMNPKHRRNGPLRAGAIRAPSNAHLASRGRKLHGSRPCPCGRRLLAVCRANRTVRSGGDWLCRDCAMPRKAGCFSRRRGRSRSPTVGARSIVRRAGRAAMISPLTSIATWRSASPLLVQQVVEGGAVAVRQGCPFSRISMPDSGRGRRRGTAFSRLQGVAAS